MRELQPINQDVILDISNSDSENMTKGGIIIPDTMNEKQPIANVIALSNIENSEIQVGDTVIYKESSGNEIEFDDKKYLVIPHSEILAKMVETEEI